MSKQNSCGPSIAYSEVGRWQLVNLCSIHYFIDTAAFLFTHAETTHQVGKSFV